MEKKIPIKNLSEYILKLNCERLKEFCANISARREFRREFGVEIKATKCMDGRVNLTRIVGLPFGIIFPHRNIGGVHRVGWPLFRATLDEWEDYAYRERRLPLLIITYHFSAGETHRGCAGFKYDKEASIQSMLELKKEIEYTYEGRISPLFMGIETDSEAIIIHGDKDKTLDNQLLAEEFNKRSPLPEVNQMFTQFPEKIKNTIGRLLSGNAKYVLGLKKEGRESADLVHGEKILALGQGFDWLNNDNDALIIGPCDPDLNKPIITAASIIKDNIEKGRIQGTPLLLVSTPYRHRRNKKGAEIQSNYLAEFAQKQLKADDNIKDLRFDLLKGTVDLETREFIPC